MTAHQGSITTAYRVARLRGVAAGDPAADPLAPLARELLREVRAGGSVRAAYERLRAAESSYLWLMPCQHCGQPYPDPRAGSRYCGGRCRTAAYRARKREPAPRQDPRGGMGGGVERDTLSRAAARVSAQIGPVPAVLDPQQIAHLQPGPGRGGAHRVDQRRDQPSRAHIRSRQCRSAARGPARRWRARRSRRHRTGWAGRAGHSGSATTNQVAAGDAEHDEAAGGGEAEQVRDGGQNPARELIRSRGWPGGRFIGGTSFRAETRTAGTWEAGAGTRPAPPVRGQVVVTPRRTRSLGLLAGWQIARLAVAAARRAALRSA